MFFATFEYADEESARGELDRIWDKQQLRGDVTLKPAGDGRWFLELCLEKELTAPQLAKLKGKRL